MTNLISVEIKDGSWTGWPHVAPRLWYLAIADHLPWLWIRCGPSYLNQCLVFIVLFSFVIMDWEHFTEWSTYSTALYSTQRPPPLGTVDTDEKLEKMAREHLIKVASEGTPTLMDSCPIALNNSLQVLFCTSSEALACGRPTKLIERPWINGPLSPVCCETVPHAAWRYSQFFESQLELVTWIMLQTTIFGQKFKAPILLAPIGVQGTLHPDAEIATATAARETGIPMILSTAATRSMEEVAEIHGDGHRWYQLYW